MTTDRIDQSSRRANGYSARGDLLWRVTQDGDEWVWVDQITGKYERFDDKSVALMHATAVAYGVR